MDVVQNKHFHKVTYYPRDPRDVPNKVIQMFRNCLESFDDELDDREKPGSRFSTNFWFKICPFLSMVTRHSVVSELQFSNSSNSPPSGFIVTFKSVSETLVNHSVMAVMQEREEPPVMMFMVQKNGTKGQCWEFTFRILFHF